MAKECATDRAARAGRTAALTTGDVVRPSAALSLGAVATDR
jgi:hypothetical protein